MTDDLVKRLRVWTMNTEDVGLRLLAADRIEQLEAALQGLFDTFLELHAKEGCDCDDCEAVRFARAALGEKKDG
jgi:hypothetical protein